MKICVFVFAFVAPVLIISICYSLMLLRLRSVRLLSGSREKDRNLRRITRLVLVVVAAFIICWTPIHIFILLKAVVAIPETTPLMAAYFLCVALGYTNSSLNPILYAFLDENFKRCFKDFCLPARRKGDRGVGGSRLGRIASRQSPQAAESAPRTAKPAWLAVELSFITQSGKEDSNTMGLTQVSSALWSSCSLQLVWMLVWLCHSKRKSSVTRLAILHPEYSVMMWWVFYHQLQMALLLCNGYIHVNML